MDEGYVCNATLMCMRQGGANAVAIVRTITRYEWRCAVKVRDYDDDV